MHVSGRARAVACNFDLICDEIKTMAIIISHR